MDSQLALVLTSSSLDQNGCRPLEPSGPGGCVDPEGKAPPGALPHNLQLFPVAAVTSGHVLSINGEKQAVGGTSNPVPPKICESSRHGQPITVNSGMPVLNNQPIRIKIVVPPRCKKPNTATFLLKDFSLSQFTRSPLASTDSVPKSVNSKTDNGKIILVPSLSATMKERETNRAMGLKIDSFREMGTKEEKKSEDVAESQNSSADINVTPDKTPLTPSSDAARAQTVKEGGAVSEWTDPSPPNLQAADWKVVGGEAADGGIREEQTEPLDLSLPKKREGSEGRCGRLSEDPVYESALIMEVDEFEGEGDRDVVEDDEEGSSAFHANDTEAFGHSVLSPSFFSNSVLSSLSSIDGDGETLLLIDDQGIPYTLSSDGLRVPQIDTPKPEDALPDQAVIQPNSIEGKSKGALVATNHSQSLGNTSSTLSEPCAKLHASLASTADSQSQGVELSTAAELLMSAQMAEKPEHPKVPQPRVPAAHEASGVLAPPSGTPVSNPPLQIQTKPSTNTPVLLSPSLSSPFPQFSSSPMGLTLPHSVTQSPAGASTPMLLLLSSVPSSSGQSVSPSTAIAVLDPSTGQLSQITATSDLSLPLSSGQVSILGSSVPPVLSHPVIRLSPNSPPVVLSGRRNNLNTAPVLTSLSVSSTTPTLQTTNLVPSGGAVHSLAPLIQTQVNSSDSKNAETEAISTEETTTGKAKPLTFTTTRSSSPLHQEEASDETFGPADQASPQAADLSLSSEPRFAPSILQSDLLPLEDHLYFSSIGAPPSPSIGPILSSGHFDSLDTLDPLSPCSSPNSLGPRRVLYCQLCPRIFFYLSDLERHAITHSQNKPHICQQCGKAFKRSSHLQRHKHIHTGQRNYVCPICAKRFREAGELQRHQRVHTGEKPYQCQLCHTRFAERNTLRRHTKRKHPYHQVAMEMLNERRGTGGEDGGVGRGGVQEEEESAEWYSSTVPNLDHTDSETES